MSSSSSPSTTSSELTGTASRRARAALWERRRRGGAGLPRALAVLALVAFHPRGVLGDQVITADANHAKVKVSGYVDGELHLRFADGSITSVPLVTVTRMVVDRTRGLTNFNEAERYLAGDQPEQSIFRYERALRQAVDFWPEMIRVRLVQACDRAGKFEKASTYFVQVSGDSPAVAADVMPTCIPASPNAVTRRIDRYLAAEANKATGEDRQALLELFRYWMLHQTGDVRATEQAVDVGGVDIPASIGSRSVYRIKAAALERLLADDQVEAVLSHATQAMETCPRSVLPDLLLLKGQALLKRSNDREDLLRAGSAFMRIPIHFPDHDSAPAGLLWAATVHEKLDRTAKAIQLLDECLAHPLLTDSLRHQAERHRSRLAEKQPE